MQAACNTLNTSIPLATARSQSKFICPSTKLSGCLSSLQNIILSLWRCSKSIKASKFLAALPSLIKIFIPYCSLPNASSAVKHSWSVLMPAAMYFFASSPLSPGAWPSTGFLYFFAAAIFCITSSSPCRTPGKFIISLKYNISSFCSNASTSATCKAAPAVSKIVAGTQLGAPKLNLKGTVFPLAIIYSTPAMPHTLAISCGSLMVATVPCTTAKRANSLGTSIELSMCTWLSIKPGRINFSVLFSAPILVIDFIFPLTTSTSP